MKKICLIISLIVCLLCFAGCSVVKPNTPSQGESGEQISGEQLPNDDIGITNPDDENNVTNSGDENDATNPDDESGVSNSGDENDVANPDDENNVTTPDDGNDVSNPDEDENENLETSVSSISNAMTTIVTKAEAEVSMPMQEAIPAESSLGFIGLSQEDFNKYVEESVYYESAISPAFQSVCMIKVNDSSKIAELKKSIHANCNPNKWVCTSAEKAVVVDCGNYILLAMSSEDMCNKLVTAFGEEFGGKLGESLSKAGNI